MMVDDTENNEFRELLSDYAEPINDDGFSDHVLMQVQKPRDMNMLKNLMIGGAALMAGFVALPQLGKLVQLIGEIKLPEISLQSGLVENSNMPHMAIIALLAVLIIGLSGSFLFSSDL